MSVDHEDRRERRFRAAPQPPQRTKRPTPITLPAADLVGELCMILLTRCEGGFSSETSPRHYLCPAPYIEETESMPKLVGKEFRKDRIVYTILISPSTPDDPDTSRVRPHECPATCSL